MALLKPNNILCCVVLILLFSCDRYKKYDSYQSLKNEIWKADNGVVFNVVIDDVQQPVDIFLNVRSDSKYQFRNLYIVSKIVSPKKNIIQDTLEYEMADAFGNWLGEGLTDVKNNKLSLLENYTFLEKGTYQFEFFQLMRKRGEIQGVSELSGITDVGLRIEALKE